jgi:hypothetical protein
MGIVNYFYGLLIGASALYWLGLAILHASRRISAPWILRPGYLALIVTVGVMTVLATLAGYGFRRRRRWALGAEALFAVCWLIWYFLWFLAPSRLPQFLEILAGTSLQLALACPMLDLWDVRHSIVFDKEYDRVVAETPSLRVRAKLPREYTLITGLFLVGFLLLLLIQHQ